VIEEKAGEETRCPIFKSELTGYYYEMIITYPTQKTRLYRLQSAVEPCMCGTSEALLSRANVQNISTGENRPVNSC